MIPITVTDDSDEDSDGSVLDPPLALQCSEPPAGTAGLGSACTIRLSLASELLRHGVRVDPQLSRRKQSARRDGRALHVLRDARPWRARLRRISAAAVHFGLRRAGARPSAQLRTHNGAKGLARAGVGLSSAVTFSTGPCPGVDAQAALAGFSGPAAGSNRAGRAFGSRRDPGPAAV